jgi:hypothetical protein
VYTLSCVTNNALVKSTLLATLNPTSTHFVPVLQKNITYCCKNNLPQGQPVFHCTHHMLIVQLTCFTYYMYTSDSWFRRKSVDSVLEQKSCIFLKQYALASIVLSLTHILNHTILYFMHKHLTYL